MKAAFIRVTSYVRAGETLERRAVLFPPQRPSRRASASLSRYDRLDAAASPRPAQPEPQVEPGSPMDAVAGMERLRAALDSLGAEVIVRTEEALRGARDEAWRDAARRWRL